MNESVTKQCFEHRHQTPQEFGVYSYICAVSYESGIFYMDGDSLAAEFQGLSGRSFYRIVNRLAAKGWLRRLKKGGRTKYGTYKCGEYAPLRHSDWIRQHPNECPSPKESIEANLCGPLIPASIDPELLLPVSATVDTGDADGCHLCQPPSTRVSGNLVFEVSSERKKRKIERTTSLSILESSRQGEGNPTQLASEHPKCNGGCEIDDTQIKALSIKIYNISGQSPAGKSKRAAETLLKEYPAEEIANAFLEDYGNRNDFRAEHAVREFFELGGGEAIILAIRERTARSTASKTEFEHQREAMQVKANEDFRKLANQLAEEGEEIQKAKEFFGLTEDADPPLAAIA